MFKTKLFVLLITYSQIAAWNNALLFAQNQGAINMKSKNIFVRILDSPLVSREAGTFHSVLVANPAVAEYNGILYFIFRGQDEGGHDQIGMWTTPLSVANGITWENIYSEPIVPISKDSLSPDNNHILDPAVLVKHDSLFVYYTGKCTHSKPDYSICLSVSANGTTFNKSTRNPILKGVIAPEVIQFNGLIYIFYQRLNPEGFWEVFVSTGTNGLDFDLVNEKKVFGPSGIKGSFDSFSIATIRIFKEGEYFYMTYAACTRYLDYPESIGLARSKNLLEWERYKGNPVFSRGQAGTWDEGALWFPTVRKIQGKYVMWYEGAGTGLGLNNEGAREASDLARKNDYGGYLSTSFSQIGVSIFDGTFSDLFK
jgi:predicted GH43/DUF377 family glycosyl hydrolase